MKEYVKVMIPEEDIEKRVAELGAQLSVDYAGKSIHLICVLKGGVYFMTALSKRISEDIPVSFDFMSVSSYGNSTFSSGEVKIIKDLDEPLEGKDVVIVEDIIDTGVTLTHLYAMLLNRLPKSLKICTLLNKPARRTERINADYVGFTIEDRFVVGCGMDYKQRYRNLPYIGEMVFEEE